MRTSNMFFCGLSSAATFWRWKTDNGHIWGAVQAVLRIPLRWAIFGKFFFSKLLKVDDDHAERSGRPDETSRRATWEIRLGFSLEETLHDGSAQSVMNEVMFRDKLGRPDIDSQEEARPQQFVIGNDEAELELSVESRSFANRVNDHVRERQKRVSNVAEKWRKTFYDLANVHDCNNRISSTRGKELFEQPLLHSKYYGSHT